MSEARKPFVRHLTRAEMIREAELPDAIRKAWGGDVAHLCEVLRATDVQRVKGRDGVVRDHVVHDSGLEALADLIEKRLRDDFKITPDPVREIENSITSHARRGLDRWRDKNPGKAVPWGDAEKYISWIAKVLFDEAGMIGGLEINLDRIFKNVQRGKAGHDGCLRRISGTRRVR